jgi:hypothetical protein
MSATLETPKRLSRPLLIGLGAAVVIGVALLALALFLAGPASSPSSPAADALQTNKGGGVTVKATWLADREAPTFAVALDTHSVALDGYDLRQLALLRVDGVSVAPASWDTPAGGHHRAGTLTFPSTTDHGSQLITERSQKVELVIRGVGEVPERVFTWER